ncbi:MAG: uridylate kinase [Candidatus Sumerlaeota bacterium]|nr:uridylate kinase [Candidatus Sumerlaeota bacterium]
MPESAPPASKPQYSRVILKLSGEMMKGPADFGLDAQAVQFIASEIADVARTGIQVGVVIGGGNIFRGSSEAAARMKRAVADHVGMLATVINALMLQDALENMQVPTRVMTALTMANIAEPYIRRRAIRHFERGYVVLFGAGTGNPFFTTDSAAALRANELDADAVLKGTKVDGIYTADPKKDPNAKFLPNCTYDRAIRENLKVMDAAALALCRDNDMPIVVYDLTKAGNTLRVVTDGDIGTKVTKE